MSVRVDLHHISICIRLVCMCVSYICFPIFVVCKSWYKHKYIMMLLGCGIWMWRAYIYLVHTYKQDKCISKFDAHQIYNDVVGVWYMSGVWVVYEWYMSGVWVVYEWCMSGVWVVYEWYMSGIWVVYEWYMSVSVDEHQISICICLVCMYVPNICMRVWAVVMVLGCGLGVWLWICIWISTFIRPIICI